MVPIALDVQITPAAGTNDMVVNYVSGPVKLAAIPAN
jgi:hypothetical protein